MYPVYFKIVHYVDKTANLLYDMSYFLKIAVLSPILLTTALAHYL